MGVSVTELLLCRRREPEPVETEQVEALVQTAIAYQQPQYVRGAGGWKWGLGFVLCLSSCLASFALEGFSNDSPMLFPLLFGGLFGAYFVFFAPSRLPDYYDSNSISAFSDGPMRMNIPGIRLTNRNWPHIVRALRLWACGTLALVPWLVLLLRKLPQWEAWGSGCTALAITAPLFFAICRSARKFG